MYQKEIANYIHHFLKHSGGVHSHDSLIKFAITTIITSFQMATPTNNSGLLVLFKNEKWLLQH